MTLPLIALIISIISLILGGLNLYLRWQERQQTKPDLVVHIKQWLRGGSTRGNAILDHVNVSIVSKSTSSTKITRIGVEPNNFDGILTWRTKKYLISARDSLDIELPREDFSDCYVEGRFLPEEVWFRVRVDGFDHAGRSSAWYSEPFSIGPP